MIRGLKHLFFENRLKALGERDCKENAFLCEHVVIGKGEWLESV